jgi:hypothetical protein
MVRRAAVDLVACRDELDDPQTGNGACHDFYELLLITFCAVLCGGQSAVGTVHPKEPFVRNFLTLQGSGANWWFPYPTRLPMSWDDAMAWLPSVDELFEGATLIARSLCCASDGTCGSTSASETW